MWLTNSFLDYLQYERNYSEETIKSYREDLCQFEKTGIVKELRSRQQFDKPSVVKRLKKERAVYVQQLQQVED